MSVVKLSSVGRSHECIYGVWGLCICASWQSRDDRRDPPDTSLLTPETLDFPVVHVVTGLPRPFGRSTSVGTKCLPFYLRTPPSQKGPTPDLGSKLSGQRGVTQRRPPIRIDTERQDSSPTIVGDNSSRILNFVTETTVYRTQVQDGHIGPVQ